MRYEVGTQRTKITTDCLDCANAEYEAKTCKAYIKDLKTNKILRNSYGWKND